MAGPVWGWEADALLCRGSGDWVREAARTPVVDVGCATEAADLAQNVLLKVVPEGSGVVGAPPHSCGLAAMTPDDSGPIHTPKCGPGSLGGPLEAAGAERTPMGTP